MDNYREALKSHFVGNPKYATIMNLEYAWWGGGLALMLVGGLIAMFVYGSVPNTIGTLLEQVGFWAVLFGVVVAFVKKSDLGVIFGAGGAAVISLIFFIITLANSGGYYFPITMLINIIVFVLIALFAYLKSDIKQRNDVMRVQQMNVFAKRHAPLPSCPTCGAPVPQGSAFCPNCGTPAPAPQPVQPYQPYQQPVAAAPAQQDFYQPAASPAQTYGADPYAPAQPVQPAPTPGFDFGQQPQVQVPAAAAAPVVAKAADSFAAPAPAPAGKFCAKCGTPNESDSAFCMNCGSPL